jgi:hypothetical protein
MNKKIICVSVLLILCSAMIFSQQEIKILSSFRLQGEYELRMSEGFNNSAEWIESTVNSGFSSRKAISCLSLKSNRVILEADYLYKVVFMTYTCKVTVLDKKLYPELQEQYCANPQSGKCPCFNVGDEFIFERNDQKDDFWHCGAGTLIKSGKEESQSATPPGTVHCGSDGVPFCSEA